MLPIRQSLRSNLILQPFLWLLVLSVLAGCGATKNAAKRQKPVPTSANSQITGTGPVTADGSSTSRIDIVIRDQNGDAMPGLTPEFTATGTGNTIGACSLTDVNGASVCALSSTVAELKTINVTAPVGIAGGQVEFVAGPAAKLGFVIAPTGGTEDQSFVPQPIVDIQDAFGNRVASGSASITLALDAGGSGTLNGTKTLSPSSGRATFTGLSLGSISASSTIKLKATAAGLSSATSGSIVVAADTGMTMSFSTQPGGGAAGVVWGTQPVVHILDGGSLATSATHAVTLSLTSGSGTLLGTRTVTAVGGVASFAGLKIDAMGSKQLTATAAGVANEISNAFAITPGAPASLQFTTQPSGGAAAQAWATQPVVKLLDAFGNVCTQASDVVSLTLQSGTGTLTGSTSVAAVNGVSTFSGLSMSVAGRKSLRATAGTLYIDSNSFDVTAGPASALSFVAQPSGGTAGVAWATQPAVEVLDAQSNRVKTFSGTVSLSLSSGSGTLSASLAAASGLANFTGLKVNTAGTGKVLSAAASGLTAVTSTPFAVVHAAPSQLQVRTQPSTGDLANTILSVQPALDLKDAFGNLITSGVDKDAPVAVSLFSGGGAVLGTGTILLSTGQGSFIDLKMSTAGAKVLRFTKLDTSVLGGGPALNVNSNSFTAAIGAPAQVKFMAQPSGGTAGVLWGTQPVVRVLDSAGNWVSTASGTVALALASGTGSLLGTASVVASSGQATFTNLKMTTAGPKTLLASMGTLATNTSGTFSIAHAAAAQVALVTSPGSAIYGQAFGVQPVVEIRDQYANVVTTGPDSETFVNVTLNSGSGLLSGSTSVTASSGVVTFTDLEIDQTGAKVLRFTKEDTSGSVGGTVSRSIDSSSFNVQAGTGVSLAIATAPASIVTAGQSFGTQPAIEVLDAAGNRATSSTAAVNATILTGAGTLLGTTTVNAVNGLATFTNLKINESGDKVIQFTASGLTSVDSGTVHVKPGPAGTLVILTQPDGARVSIPFTTQPVLEIRDIYGNLVDEGVDATANVTASLFSGTGSLLGSLSMPADGGVVTYANISATMSGTKRLRFTKADLSGSGGSSSLVVNSNVLTVGAGEGVGLSFSVQPGGGTAGIAWPTQPKVEIVDAQGNVDTLSTAAVTLTLSTGSGPLLGTVTQNAVNGVATFTDLKLEGVGTNKVLTASASGLNSANSSAFTITAGAPADSSDVTISAGPKWSNDVDTYTITVTARDSYGNLVPGATVSLNSSRAAQDTFAPSSATTGSDGKATFTVKSTTGGTSIVTATLNPGAVTTTASVSAVFDDYRISAAQSSWSQDRVSTIGNAVSLITVSGTARNAAGVALPQKVLTMTSSRGVNDAISPASVTTDANGLFSFTVRSATYGVSNLTITCAADSVNVTTTARAQFLALVPYADFVPAHADADALKHFAGSNALPTSVWKDMSLNGNYDGTLNGFAYSNTTSGWMGDGTTTISSGATGPYRLGFNAGNAVDFGTLFNGLGEIGFEAWIRPTSVATAARTILSNGGGANGLTLRSARDASGKLEVFVGARTYADEVIADAASGYWRLNEASGTAAAAGAGASAGTYVATPTFSQGGALNTAETSVLLNGTSQYVNIGNVYNNTGNYTYEAWVYLPSAIATSARTVLAKRSAAQGLALEVDTSQLATFSAYVGSTLFKASGTTSLATATWYHLVGVRSTKSCTEVAGTYSVRIYVNGVKEGCTNITGTPVADTVALRIGSDVTTGATSFFPGRIDEVAVYAGTQLSDARILAHYAARTVNVCQTTASLTNNAWRHVVASHASNTLKLHVNGVEHCSRATTGLTLSGSTNRLGAGASLNPTGVITTGTQWSGALGDIRIYDRGLTTSEALSNFNAQSGRYP